MLASRVLIFFIVLKLHLTDSLIIYLALLLIPMPLVSQLTDSQLGLHSFLFGR